MVSVNGVLGSVDSETPRTVVDRVDSVDAMPAGFHVMQQRPMPLNAVGSVRDDAMSAQTPRRGRLSAELAVQSGP